MIEDLKRDSARWRTEQDRRQRSGRSTGMIYVVEHYPPDKAEEITGSYADMKGREEVLAEPVDVDMDDYDRPARSRHDLDPRRETAGRHGLPAVSSGYPPEPGYYVSSTQPGNYGPETLPRSHQDYRNPGNSTPPTTTRAGQPGYSQAGYPPRTTATAPPAPIPSYRDPRTGQLIPGYEPSYPAEPRRRHQ
jgi:hypothetical protein